MTLIQSKPNRRRSAARSLAGAPALVAIISGMLIAPVLLRGSSGDMNWYETRAEQARRSGDFRTAATCYARLVQANPSDPRLKDKMERMINLLELEARR